MLSSFSTRIEHWPLAKPFRISRGVKTEAVVAVVEAREDVYVGRGESVPYARYDETPDSVLAQLEALAKIRPSELTRADLLQLLPPGAARNAVDCALWDLEAQRAGHSVGEILGNAVPTAFTTAVTVSLDHPDKMAEAASRNHAAALIKIKVDAQRPDQAIEAVARAAPRARLIVDPNESWSYELLRELQPFLAQWNVALVEQPLPAASDDPLKGFVPLVPLCADESLHTAADLVRVGERYQVINIKLDKTGGLTEALGLRSVARARGLGIMVGCMVCTSLGIAPALELATDADFLDLDGPWWLTKDRPNGVRIEDGILTLSSSFLWGR
jgi:L-alanine-DL-glutamate epimerase-like enolase superfamily enzyme